MPSNRVDYFQAPQEDLAIPAGTASVSVEGTLCPDLEPVELVRAGWPRFGHVRLAYNPAARASHNLLSIEDIEARFGMGQAVTIEQIYNCLPGGVETTSLVLFAGRIENIETKIDAEGEHVEILARDGSAIFERVSVYGRHVADSNGGARFLAGLDTIFNPDGKSNANPTPATHEGAICTVFGAEPSQCRPWTYAETIDYLLTVYRPAVCIQRPSLEQLLALTAGAVARDLDVTGLNLLAALQRCCERCGLSFTFVPYRATGGSVQAIVFSRGWTGRTVELNCQHAGGRIQVGQTDVASLRGRRSFYPVTRRVVGQGDFKVFEATFELVKAWDPALQSTDYYRFSPSTNSEFYQVRDVYRKWCLNEAGDYSGPPYNRGPAYDLSKVFENDRFVPRRRRFWPALSTDRQNRSLGYYLQVSFDGGDHWWQYLYAFNNLLDECGIWLSSDQLDVDTWVAALKGELQFRITASVVGDERLTAVVVDGPVGSAAPVVDQLVTLPRQFKFRKVTRRSIFFNSADENLGLPDEADDSAAVYESVRQRASAGLQTIETVDVATPMLLLDYQVGDRVTSSPESRDLFACRGDNRSTRWIEHIRMDFRRQCTELRIVRRRTVDQ